MRSPAAGWQCDGDGEGRREAQAAGSRAPHGLDAAIHHGFAAIGHLHPSSFRCCSADFPQGNCIQAKDALLGPLHIACGT